MELSAYKLKIPNKNLKRAQRIKEALESSCWAKTSLLSMALLGTCMVIGDGILTPHNSGTEAMFADVGHFSVRSIQIAFSRLVYPCLIYAYIGQATYLSIFPENITDAFYKSIPESIYWQ